MESRTSRLEILVSAMPAGSDISRLDITLANLRGELRALSTRQDSHTLEVQGVAASLRRVEDYLVARQDNQTLFAQTVNESIEKLCAALRNNRGTSL